MTDFDRGVLNAAGVILVIIVVVIVSALLLGGCRVVMDQRANGGEIITIGTPAANPCAPTCPEAGP